MNWRVNTDRSAAVSRDVYWLDVSTAPRGVKCLLLTTYGVATIGNYDGDEQWVGWFPLPRKPASAPTKIGEPK